MEDKDYDYAIGKLTRLRVWLKPKYHASVDELIDALVDESEGLTEVESEPSDERTLR